MMRGQTCTVVGKQTGDAVRNVSMQTGRQIVIRQMYIIDKRAHRHTICLTYVHTTKEVRRQVCIQDIYT